MKRFIIDVEIYRSGYHRAVVTAESEAQAKDMAWDSALEALTFEDYEITNDSVTVIHEDEIREEEIE